MIATLINFPDEATAKADPVVGKYFIDNGDGTSSWRGDVCFPNTQVWNPANDTTDDDGNVTHKYESGWFIIIDDKTNQDAIAAKAYALPQGYVMQPVPAGTSN